MDDDDGAPRQEWMRAVAWTVIIGLALPSVLHFLGMPAPWRVAVVVAALALLGAVWGGRQILRREE